MGYDDNNRSFQDFNTGGKMEEMVSNPSYDAELLDGSDLAMYDKKIVEYDKRNLEADNRALNELLRRSFRDMLEKHKIKNISYKDFSDIINGLSEYSRREAEFNKLYLSKLTSAITDATLIKTVVALGMLIDSAIAKIMQIAENNSGESYLAIVATIEKTFLWIDKIEELKKRYYISGVDASIQQLADLDSGDKAEERKLNVEQIRQLITKAAGMPPSKPKETPKQG